VGVTPDVIGRQPIQLFFQTKTVLYPSEVENMTLAVFLLPLELLMLPVDLEEKHIQVIRNKENLKTEQLEDICT
jgi:hypothetical protein